MHKQDWSIQEVARLAGTTSRTLRHYDAIGLLPPTRIAGNGYRHYDQRALVRLQRILLRELGLGLAQIAEVIAEEGATASALAGHLGHLREEQERLTRKINAVTRTVAALEEGEPLMAETMFDGFDHTHYRDEVEQRWGADAYATGDRWWRSMSQAERADWKARQADLQREWVEAAEAESPDGTRAQDLAQRHVEWLRSIPGTPAGDPARLAEYITGLGEMYVADPRFAANYGGQRGAEFVRDALAAYVRNNL